MADDFSKARDGDRLWVYPANQYGEVTGIDMTSRYPVSVKATNGSVCCFPSDGLNEMGAQVLFWDRPEIIAPPRPKRMVQKEITFFPAISDKGGVRINTPKLYWTEEQRNGDARIKEAGWIFCEPVTIRYEAEED